MFFNDNILILSLIIVVMAFLASYRTFPIIINVSVIKNLTASPNERSSHIKKTPNLGGLGISFGAFLTSAFFGSIMLECRDDKYITFHSCIINNAILCRDKR